MNSRAPELDAIEHLFQPATTMWGGKRPISNVILDSMRLDAPLEDIYPSNPHIALGALSYAVLPPKEELREWMVSAGLSAAALNALDALDFPEPTLNPGEFTDKDLKNAALILLWGGEAALRSVVQRAGIKQRGSKWDEHSRNSLFITEDILNARPADSIITAFELGLDIRLNLEKVPQNTQLVDILPRLKAGDSSRLLG
jgi:hypothetical protein